MSKTNPVSKIVFLIGCSLLTLSLLLPWAQGKSPLSLGLDLSGGVMVTYRPDFESVPERYAQVPEPELLAMAKDTLTGRLFHRFETLPDVVVRSDGRIVVSLPGDFDQRQVLETVGKTYRLTFRQALADHAQKPDGAEGLVLPYAGRWLELGPELLAGDMLDPRSIRVEVSDGSSLETLGQGAAVTFEFRPPYDQRFAELTGGMVDQTLAILLDDRVEWAGAVESEIRGPGMLRGGYTVSEAAEVAGLLRSGNLPLSLAVESISGVGPGLGQEILESGQTALAWSVGLLALLILAAYGRRPALLLTGWVSLGSLLFFTLGMISLFGLTVDLVAIAGLVLSIGMGMDAFILIFEAFEGDRQTCDRARSPLSRLKAVYGFRGEGRTLVHANATTLLVVMLLLAQDRLRSFALFLMVGLAASLITVFVTRRLLAFFASRGWLEPNDGSAWHPMAGLRSMRPGIFRWSRLYLAGLAAFLIATAAFLQSRHQGQWLPLGSDFQPGMQLQLALGPAAEIEPCSTTWSADFPGIQARHQVWTTDDLGAQERGYVVTLEGEPWQEESWRASASEGASATRSLTPESLGHWLEQRQVALKGMHSIDARLSGRRILGSLSVLAFSFLLLGLYLGIFQGKIDRRLARPEGEQESGGRYANLSRHGLGCPFGRRRGACRLGLAGNPAEHARDRRAADHHRL